MFDVIVIGARCAGSPTAMLLARRGYKVLLVDKATFPSDTISTHLVWPHGAEALGRWGLLDRLEQTNLPPSAGGWHSISALLFYAAPSRMPMMARWLLSAKDRSRSSACERRGGSRRSCSRGLFRRGPALRRRPCGGHFGQIGRRADCRRARASGHWRRRVHSMVAKAVRAPEYQARPVLACAY